MGLSDLDTKLFARLIDYIHLDHNEVSRDSVESTLEKTESVTTKIKQKQKRLNPEEILGIIKDYKSGLTVYQLAEKYDCHRTTVSQKLKNNGVKMRGQPISKHQIEESIKLYESGLSCAKIGEVLNVDAETVRQALIRSKITLRNAHY